MKLKRTYLLFILFFLSNCAFALGLGFAKVNTYINQPLSATIDIKHLGQVAPEDIKVYLSSALDFQRFGIEKTYFLRQLNYRVVYKEGQNAYILVTTKKPVKEPLIDFVITVQWPEGNITRDYNLFLNPNPIVAKISRPKITKNTQPSRVVQNLPTSVRVKRQAPITTNNYYAEASGSYGPTKNGESISMIAQRIRPDDSYSVQRIMRAIHQMNPDAFIDGDINRLKMGRTLSIPPMERAEFKKSGYAFTPRPESSAKKQKMVGKTEKLDISESQAQESQKDDSELRLLSTGEQQDLSMLEIENPTQDDIDQVSNELVRLTLERVKRLKDENLALRQRFDMLVERMEDAVEKNARLDEQLAALQTSNKNLAESGDILQDVNADVDESLAESIGDEQSDIPSKLLIEDEDLTKSSDEKIAERMVRDDKKETIKSQEVSKVKVNTDVKPKAKKEEEDGLLSSILNWLDEVLSIWYLVIAIVLGAVVYVIKFIWPKYQNKLGIMDKFSLYRRYKGGSVATDDIDDIDLDLFEAKEEKKVETAKAPKEKESPSVSDTINKDESIVEELEVSSAGTLSAQEDAVDDLDDIFGEPAFDGDNDIEPDHGSSVQSSSIQSDSQIDFSDILGTPNNSTKPEADDGVDIISQSSVYFAYGKFDLAEQLIKDGLETDPDNKKYKLKLMECYAKMDNEEDFLNYLSKFSDLYSGDEEFKTKVQKLYKDRWKKELY